MSKGNRKYENISEALETRFQISNRSRKISQTQSSTSKSYAIQSTVRNQGSDEREVATEIRSQVSFAASQTKDNINPLQPGVALNQRRPRNFLT